MQKILIKLTLIILMLSGCSKDNSVSEIIDNADVSVSDGSGTNGNTQEPLELTKEIPVGANTWVKNNSEATKYTIVDAGIINWTEKDDIFRVYFKASKIGKLNIGLKGKNTTGNSTIKVSFNGDSKVIDLKGNEFEKIEVGVFEVKDIGYNFIELEGVDKSGDTYGEVGAALIGGEVVEEEVTYIKNDFYFGRRGPSVHLQYTTPSNNIKWYYGEVEVPKDSDVEGSFFMVNGFREGYFGMQVNSSTERRVLFSVWSAYDTQNPAHIPNEYKVVELAKGNNVTVGDFGNEGSGKQSYKTFDWKTETNYKFLLKGEPSTNNSTDYTAYFFAPETGSWELIASFRRPKTSSHLKGYYSFLENFLPEKGDISREVNFLNQWCVDVDGNWHAISKAKFTGDATATNRERLDYNGGVRNDKMFLKNCGFFNASTALETILNVSPNNTPPVIDFDALPN